MRCTPRNGNCGSGTGYTRRAHEVRPRRHELAVLAAERDRRAAAAAVGPAHRSRDLVGVQARARRRPAAPRSARRSSRRRAPTPSRDPDSTAHPRRIVAPAASISAASARHTSRVVDDAGVEHVQRGDARRRAARARAAAPDRSSRCARRSPRSAARARRAGAGRRRRRATTTLPHTAWSMPCSRQYSTIETRPAVQSRALSEPGW